MKMTDYRFALLYGIAIRARRAPSRRLVDGHGLLWLERHRYISRALGRGRYALRSVAFPSSSATYKVLRRGWMELSAGLHLQPYMGEKKGT